MWPSKKRIKLTNRGDGTVKQIFSLINFNILLNPSKEISKILLFSTYPLMLFASYQLDFDKKMEYNKSDSIQRRQARKDNEITDLCRELYAENNMNELASLDEPIIPKIVHLIWLGPNKAPEILDHCIASIHEHLPEWGLKIWTDVDVEEFNLVNKEWYDKETNYGAKSDIFRYEILYRYGGVYLDVDFVLLKPLDVLHHTYTFYTSLLPSNMVGILANGIIGSVPGHPILKECIDSMKDSAFNKSLLARTGPMHFQKAFYKIVKNGDHSRIIAFPKNYFIPVDKKETSTTGISEESFAVHYWSGSWNRGKK